MVLAAYSPERYGREFFASCARCGLCSRACTLGIMPHVAAASALSALGGSPSSLLGTDPVAVPDIKRPDAKDGTVVVPGRDTLLHAPGSVNAFLTLAEATGTGASLVPELPETGHALVAQGILSVPESLHPARHLTEDAQVVLLSPLEWYWAETMARLEEVGDRVLHDRNDVPKSMLRRLTGVIRARLTGQRGYNTGESAVSGWNRVQRLTPQELLEDGWNMEVQGRRKTVMLHIPCIYDHDSPQALALERITARVADVVTWHPSEEQPWHCGALTLQSRDRSESDIMPPMPPDLPRNDDVLVTPCPLALNAMKTLGIRAENLWEFILQEAGPAVRKSKSIISSR